MDFNLEDLGGITFWGMALAGTTVGFSYVIVDVKDILAQKVSNIFGRDSLIDKFKAIGRTAGLLMVVSFSTIAFGYVTNKARQRFKHLLTQ